MRTILVRVFAAIAIVILILVIGVFALTNTDWGHKQVQKRVVGSIQNSSHGIIRVGSVTGNLLKGFTLHNLVITDSTGAPFVKADEASARYAIRTLTGSRVDFDEVRLVRPVIVLDRKPGGIWNYDRIFPRHSATETGVEKTGWGTYVRFTNVTLVDGDITVRSPWEPKASLPPVKRQAAMDLALGPDGRFLIGKVSNGYQKISKFHHVDAKLPLVRLEDPDNPTRRADVASLSMIAEPFKPPAVRVKSLAGRFDFTSDSVWFKNISATLPGSELTATGRYTVATNNLTLRSHANRIAVSDLRWVEPRLPERGSGKLDFALDWVGDTSVYKAHNADLTIGDAHLAGELGMTVLGEDISFQDTDLRFADLDTRLIEQVFPTLKSPRSGILTGRAKVDGDRNDLAVDGDFTFDDRKAGRNRVVAVGNVGFPGGAFRADNLRLRLEPVLVELARTFVPTLPIGGTITGTATVDGSTESRMTARADITHVDRGSVSRITGNATIRGSAGATMASSWFDLDARVHPLSLVTVGRFAPTAGLRGTAEGPIHLTGTMRNLAVRSQLGFSDGGSVGVIGRFDLASREISYNADVTAHLFNANTILARAPKTSLNATASANGRGSDPATLQTNIVADFQASVFDTISVEGATVRLAAANGMARIDTLTVVAPQGELSASGNFGLAPGRSGQLRYHVSIDSLNQLASLLPPPTDGAVAPRPGILASRAAAARQDSTREAKATEVERAAMGRPPVTMATVDSPTAISLSVLSGSLKADGVATGNIRDFGLTGTASGSDIIARGNTVQRFNATYDWTRALTPQSHLDVNAYAGNVSASGFALDSVHAKIGYTKPQGAAELTVVQNTRNIYSVNADFLLNKVRNELQLNRMLLRFDSTLWTSTRPSIVHWGEAGIDVDKLEIRNQGIGRIYIDGLIPKEGRANVQIAVDNFAVQDLISLAQSDIDARGLLSFDVKAVGTATDPTFTGSFGTQNFFYNGTSVPEVHGVLNYADETLKGRADATVAGGQSLLFAEGSVPINLALQGVTGSRFPKDRQIDLAVRADSLSLTLIPQINTYVTNLKGSAVADFKVAGTLNRPEVSGTLNLRQAEAHVSTLGIDLKRINASVRMLRDTVVIDSLVAYSNGRIALTGGLGIGSLRSPSFDLKLFANNAILLKNDNGYLKSNIDLAIAGPFTDAHVGGNVRLLDGVLYVPKSEGKQIIGSQDAALFNVLDTAVVANREIFPTQSPLLANLRMDVNLRVDRDVFVRSADYNIEVYSDGDLAVHVNRAKESLVLDGVLLSERGDYRFLSKRFEVNRGSATFTNSAELNPTLQVAAGYEVRLPGREAFNIRILVGGTLLKPQISLESDAQPPIAQSDLLSYLAFGRSSSSLLQLEGSGLGSGDNLVGAGATLASRQLAAVAIGTFADQLSGEAARSLGVDEFNISPADVQSDVGNFLRGTELEAGKYIKSHTFVALQVRPDPAALARPGFLLQHRFGGLRGYSFETTFQPRYLLRDPTLELQTPTTTSVFSFFLIRNWRF